MLTPDEKWYFDHHGFLILRQVVPPADIERMIQLGHQWHAMALDELPPPLTSTADTHPDYSPTIARWINHVQYGDPLFQGLVLNREIMRVVIALTQGHPVLVDTALTKNYRESDDIHFHAAGQEYEVSDGAPYAGFLNAGISLVDVPAGTGFVCLLGSHKRNFEPLMDPHTGQVGISIYDETPTVVNIPVNAGDCLIFTEALYHGARRWTEDYPRFTIFNRYRVNLPTAGPIENYKHLEPYRYLIPNEVYELQQPANAEKLKPLVQRIIDDVNAGFDR